MNEMIGRTFTFGTGTCPDPRALRDRSANGRKSPGATFVGSAGSWIVAEDIVRAHPGERFADRSPYVTPHTGQRLAADFLAQAAQ